MRVLLFITVVTGVGAGQLYPNTGSTQDHDISDQEDVVLALVSMLETVISVVHSTMVGAPGQ